MNTPTPPRQTFRTRLASLARLSLAGFCLLSTFAFLTAGMSDSQPNRNDAGDKNENDDTPRLESVSLDAERRANNTLSQNTQTALVTQWQQQIDAQSLTAAPPADWLTVNRRLSLALVGSGLSLEEIRDLERFPEPERIDRYRESLLTDPRFHDYWSERFTRFYVGADEGPFIVYRRRRFRTWLSDQFAENVRYDALVRRLITAEGIWTDRPEVNFYTVTFDSGDGQPDPIRMAARTCRAFLGIRIDCLQCHDDFLGNVSLGDPDWMGGNDDFRDGTQQDFHSLAAFFTAASNQGLQGIRNQRPNYQYQYLDETEEQSVAPDVPFLRGLLPSEPEEVELEENTELDNTKLENESNEPWINHRRRLADWLTHRENVQFSRAFVTRVWTLMFGTAPTAAVDDLPLNETPRPIIMTLSSAFIESDYDIRELIRMITDTPAFRVDSQSPTGEGEFEITARHELAMAAFPIVRLRAEQVAGAAIQAGRVKTLNRESSLLLQLQQFGDRNEFLRRYGDLGEDEFENESVTITQRLVMLNGELTSDMSSWNPILNTSSHVGMFATDDVSVVESLYLANLNRYPTDVERDHFVERLGSADSRENAIVDMVWVLLNSSEFAWNH